MKADANVIQDLQSPDSSYSFEKCCKHTRRTKPSPYANRLVTHDIYNKKITTFDYDYHEQFAPILSYAEHDQGNRTESKYLRPLAKLDDADKHYQITLLQKLMNVDTKKVHNDFEFTPPEDILPNKRITKLRMDANFHLLLTVPANKNESEYNWISFALPTNDQYNMTIHNH